MNTLQPLNTIPFKYVNDLTITSIAGGGSFVISPGRARDSTNLYDIVSESTLTVRSDVIGVNGIDNGTVAASTWYAVFIISDPTNRNPVAGLFSLSSTAPVMPSINGVPYSAFRLIGWQHTTGASIFEVMAIVGNGNTRQTYYDAMVNILTGGSATTFTTVSCANAIPNYGSSILASAQLIFTPASAGNYVAIRPFGSGVTAADLLTLSGSVAAVVERISTTLLVSATSGIQYQNSAAACSTTLSIRGFEYFI